MSLDILSNRAKGEFPLSIGTAIALESFFNLKKEYTPHHEIAPYKKYDCVCINLSTLVRNMIASIKSSELKEVTRKDFITTLENEIEIITQLFNEYGNGRVSVFFYYNYYTRLDRELKGGNFKVKMTDNQVLTQMVERDVPRHINPKLKNLEVTQLMITHGRRNNLLLSHNPLDLLFNSLTSVALLESHTGKIKLPNEFNTKLKSSPDYIPFNKITIQVYGDKGNTLLPMSSKFRTLFSQEANKLGVNSAMDLKRFVSRMKESKENEVKALIMKLK